MKIPIHSTNRRELVYYVATTVDHYIAHADGSIDGFTNHEGFVADFMASLTQFDTVLMGKNTYEFGYQYGLEPGQPAYAPLGLMNYVFSQTMPEYTHEKLRVIQDDPTTFVQSLKQESGKPIWLCGGGAFAGYLLDHQLIDRLIIKQNPVVFGMGIPLFGNSKTAVNLTLEDVIPYDDAGIVVQNYRLNYS